jgi:hypothetical protein
MIEFMLAFLLVTVLVLVLAAGLVVIEVRNAARWRLVMTRLYATPTLIDHAMFDDAFVHDVAARLKLDQAQMISGIVEAVRQVMNDVIVADDQMTKIIDTAVDKSIGARLPTAEQFEASVKAMVTAREQRANGRDSAGRA